MWASGEVVGHWSGDLALPHQLSLPPGLQCNASVDLIGTCWPRSPAGQLVARPCPAFFYGVRYNTTSKGALEGRPSAGRWDRMGKAGDLLEVGELMTITIPLVGTAPIYQSPVLLCWALCSYCQFSHYLWKTLDITL